MLVSLPQVSEYIINGPLVSHPTALETVNNLKSTALHMKELQDKAEELEEKEQSKGLAKKALAKCRASLAALCLDEVLLRSPTHHISLKRLTLCRILVDCLDDEAISLFMSMAHDCARSKNSTVKAPAVLSPLVCSIANDFEDLLENICGHHVRTFPWGTFDTTLLPFHMDSCEHWVLVVICWESSKVKIYNSMLSVKWKHNPV